MNPETFAIKAVNFSKSIEAKYTEWYPCGFANIQVKGARGKISDELKALGFKKDDYNGGMYLSMSKFTPKQSMYLKEELANELMKDLKAAYPNLKFFTWTRID
jgi:hypothetical protein